MGKGGLGEVHGSWFMVHGGSLFILLSSSSTCSTIGSKYFGGKGIVDQG